MKNRLEIAIFWTVILLLLLCTRIPSMARYLSIDNVNLALSIEEFNPAKHQPQPPGYPLFVLLAHVVICFFHNVEKTFTAISILVTAISLWVAFYLGSRMFSQWAGLAGLLLLLVNPVMWHAGVEGPLRPNLALFSLLTAYCCWRCWNGEKRFALWGAVALGVGSGFRPDLIAFLFPLWLVSSWVGTRSWRTVVLSAAALAAIVATWTSAVIIAMGGLHNFRSVMLAYAGEWSQSSSAGPGASAMNWLLQKNRLFIWNALGVITWIWAVPIAFLNRNRPHLNRSHILFLSVWIVPGIMLQAVTHFANPGHTLVSVSALCLVGGYVISVVVTRELVLASALILNTLLFLDNFPMPSPETSPGTKPSLVDLIAVGTYESSVGWIKRMDEITDTALAEIKAFTPADRPSIIMTTESYVDQWFMNWRIGRYYLRNRDIWVIDSGKAGRRFGHIRLRPPGRARPAQPVTVVSYYQDRPPFRIPVFRAGRILWLLEPNSRVLKELAGAVKLTGAKYVSYVDITRDSPSFTVDGFEIVPSDDGSK
jgi:hypothetical protein